ncbi:MAG: prepilin-type N-terminal cleavage/methylation domain-containing protein [Lacipirellulaceae bacterium]
MKKSSNNAKRGFSLLELSIAMAMMAALSAASMVLLRTSQNAWNRHRDDHERSQSASAALRHIVRNARQSVAVTAITSPTNNSGSLSLQRSDGAILVWNHDGVNDQVNYGITTASSLLSNYITALTFTGYKADGISTTEDVDLIHIVECTVTYELDRPTGTTAKQLTSRAWLRSW